MLTEEHKIDSLYKLVSLNRYNLKQFLKKLDLDNQSFSNPSNEDIFLKLLDKEDSRHGNQYRSSILSSNSSCCDEEEFELDMAEQKLSLNEAAFAPAMSRSRFKAPKMKMKMKKSARIMSPAMNDPDDDTIGFKVGGSYDITPFRDKLQHKTMPSKNDFSVEGIYNDYYFNTKRKQKGTEIKDDEHENDETIQQTEGGNDDDNKQAVEQEEHKSGKDLFYPSYCYAKSKIPFAILAAKSVTKGLPDIDYNEKDKNMKKNKKTGIKKDKSGNVSKENIVSCCDEKDLAIWNGYIIKFGYEPKGSHQLHNFTKGLSKYKRMAFKDVRSIYNKYKNGGKIVVQKEETKTTTKKETVTDEKKEEVKTEAIVQPMKFNDMFEDDADDITFNVDENIMNNREIYMTVGLNSNISAKDFQRKKLNVCILLDISGSMNKPFANDKVSSNKIEIAKQAIYALIINLKHDDRFSLVTFNRSAQTYCSLAKISEHRMDSFRRINNIWASGGTTFANGYGTAIQIYIDFYAKMKVDDIKEDLNIYDNRIIMLTDLNPNMAKKDPQKLIEKVESNSKNEKMRIYTSFIGIGLDFNSDLVSKVSGIRGSNYCGVHSNDEFIKRMSLEFNYLVSPLVFDFSLTLKSEGDVAYVEEVYGAGSGRAESLKKGEIMKVSSLFPSPPSEETGDKKGGIILLKIKKKNDSGDMFNMIIECKFEDKYGKKYLNKQIVEFGDDNKYNVDDYYDNNGIQKGILLARYMTLINEWIKHDKYHYIYNKNAKIKNKKNLFVSARFKKIFESFKKYFEKEINLINDNEMKQEIDLLAQLISDNLEPLNPPKPKDNILSPNVNIIAPNRPRKIKGRPYNILNNNCEYDNNNCNVFNFESLEAETKMVKCIENKWTLKPLCNIMNDICIDGIDNINIEYDNWLTNALSEHASIASFSKFSLDLISLGSPSFLIELTHKAILDEIKHSKIAFDICNLFLNTINNNNSECVVNPSKIQSHNIIIDGNCDRILNDLINGGCFNELISALQSIKDSIKYKSKTLLYEVAIDETKHCALAWIATIWIINNKKNNNYNIIHEIYNNQLKNINNNNDNSSETLYALNVVVPQIMNLLLMQTDENADYENLYIELVSILKIHMDTFNNMEQEL